MTVLLSPVYNGFQGFLPNGLPNAGGLINTYLAGTTTPAATYTTSAGTIQNANPIVLNAAGQPPAAIWLTAAQAYKFVYTDAAGNNPVTIDNITAALVQSNSYSLGTVVGSITALRALDKTKISSAFATGYTNQGDGGGGAYYYDSSDTTSTDNGGSIIVALDGGRWKLTTATPWSVKQFGAKGDGVTDDTGAILNALTALGSGGGSVVVPAGAACVVNSGLTLPPSTHLVGPHSFVGSPGNNVAANYAAVKGSILLSSSATITLSSGASLKGLLIYRKGMAFPSADATLFAGTAVTISGDDAAVSHCQILGFNKAIYSNNSQRPRIDHVWHDNVNGIEITACADIPYVFECHAWPFATIAYGAAGLKDTRSGTAYFFHDLVDWGKFTNCFSWGYLRGIQISNANSCTVLNCGTDNFNTGGVPQLTNSIGCEVLGSSQDTRILGFQAAAQYTTGIHINTSAGLHTQITDAGVWGGSTHGVLIDGGDVTVISGCPRNVTNGITVTNAASRVFIDEVRFQQISSIPVYATVASPLIFIGPNNDFGDFGAGQAIVSGNSAAQSVASAAAVSLPPSGTVFNITGTTNFGTLSSGWAGRNVTLIFAGVLTVNNSTGAIGAMRLSGAANYTTTAGGTLSLAHNGTQWFETGRSA